MAVKSQSAAPQVAAIQVTATPVGASALSGRVTSCDSLNFTALNDPPMRWSGLLVRLNKYERSTRGTHVQ